MLLLVLLPSEVYFQWRPVLESGIGVGWDRYRRDLEFLFELLRWFPVLVSVA
jgi:hypothetical protein